MDEQYSFLDDDQYSFLDDDETVVGGETGEPPDNNTCTNALNTPAWIDWNCTNYPLGGGIPGARSYRKITNVWGGDTQIGDLKWLSEFDTEKIGRGVVNSTKYEIIPKYLWGLDIDNKKLKVSSAYYKDYEETLKKDPVVVGGKCSENGGKSHICCEDSSSTADGKCVYSWNGETVMCSSKNHFSSLSDNTTNNWTYFNKDTDAQAGTFCMYKSGEHFYSDNLHMKNYIGCKCAEGNSCNNIEKGSTSKCSDKISANLNDEWKFIDEAAAVACCNLSEKGKTAYPQCQGGFDILGVNKNNNKCPQLMEEFCRDHWTGDGCNIIYEKNLPSSATADASAKRRETTKNICSTWLSNLTPESGAIKEKSIQLTIQGYITNQHTCAGTDSNGPRSPQDYISPALYKFDKAAVAAAKENGTALLYESPSILYYDDLYCDKNCNAAKNPNNLSSCNNKLKKGKKRCDRDDSKSDFFNKSLPEMCKSPAGRKGATCKPQLQYFCAQFTRDQLLADDVLLGVCGCYAVSSDNNGQTGGDVVGMRRKMELLNGNNPNTLPKSVYYGGLTEHVCDPICIGSKIGNLECTRPMCIMDNVSINLHNSDVGGSTNIFQDCKDGTCYIKDTVITADKSTIKGRIEIDQKCKTCYTFTDSLEGATKVECSTLTNTPLTDTPPGNAVKNILKDEGNNKIIIVVVIIIIGAIIGFLLYKYK
jgi:hypothetical protein